MVVSGFVSRSSQDLTLARRLITIAVSDFLCWFPIGLLGVLASQGYPIPSEVSVAMAIVVLPFNSAMNPFLYTLNMALERRGLAKEERLKKRLLAEQEAADSVADKDVHTANTDRQALQLVSTFVRDGLLTKAWFTLFSEQRGD